MHPEKYSLTWFKYSDHLKSMMKELMMNEDFSDVTLVTEDKKHIKANINILSACSPIFKDILKKDKNSNPIMYLRGIQFSEMESIMQFIYLGEATFYEERMNEFLAVAKSLEVKELCSVETKSNNESDDCPLPNDTLTEVVKEPTDIIKLKKQAQPERQGSVVTGKYECDQCHKTYSSPGGLHNHKQSVHLGVKYNCDQCDYQAGYQGDLNTHIKSKHEGVKYTCNQCDYQANHQSSLKLHTQSKHEGFKYACNQCDYQVSYKRGLKEHVQSQHEGLKKQVTKIQVAF